MQQNRPLNQLYIARLLGFEEKGLEWVVQQQDGEPAFFRIGLNPVASLHPVGFARTEIHVGRAVAARHRSRRRITLAHRTRVVLRRVER